MKETWHNYHIKFIPNQEEEAVTQRYKATSPGQAFAKCLNQNPDCKLLEGWIEGRHSNGYGYTTYDPPSTVRIVPEKNPKPKETTFKFYDDCLGKSKQA